ncbi:MAG: hypothetical protein MUF06_21625, partial [Pirellulaceae bacterium]|nr:hypothetical protein [Pirellulaceae bacterium]
KNYVVRKVDAKTGLISTVAGTGKLGFSGDGGPATKAQLNIPHSIALDGDDNLYIADIGNHRIRKVDAKTGVITTIAGNGEKQQPTAGPAAGKPMLGPRALFIDGQTLWIALREGHAVWKLDLASGQLTHVAGTGNVYVVDTENHAIRQIDTASGTISTIAGLGPKHPGGTGDGGPATEATLDRPHGICIGPDGAVYIGDTLNHRVRVVRPKQ